jgi:hypothetical protein
MPPPLVGSKDEDRTTPMCAARLPTAILLAAAAFPAAGGLHKCVDADGNVTYRQTMCPAHVDSAPTATSAHAAAGRRDPGAETCDAIRGLAEEVARAMKRGLSSSDAVQALGGAEQIDQNALEVITYVYSFAGRKSTAVGQIAALAAKKCRAGGFSIAASPPEPAAPALAPVAETPAAAASPTPTPPQ